MPHHKQVTCRRNAGPLLRRCTCDPCNNPMCMVCGASNESLTTDCPGAQVSYDRQCEVHDTCLDYTDNRGWHQGARAAYRTPHFTGAAIPPVPPRADPREVVAPTVDWSKVDQHKALQQELTLRAIAWVLADRQCDELSAELAQSAAANEDLQANFQRTCLQVEECDDEFRQAARKLVASLEDPSRSIVPTAPPTPSPAASPRLPALSQEIQGTVKAEHLPRTIDRLEQALEYLLEALPDFDGGGPLVEQIAEEMVSLRFAARDICLSAGIPWTSSFEQARARHFAQTLLGARDTNHKDAAK